MSKGFWICEHCGHAETYEREVWCWQCGKGEMLYTKMPGVACIEKEEDV